MAIFYLRRIDTPILFNEKGSRVAACMVIYMTLKLAMTAAITLWKTGLPEKAIKYIYDKANVILLDERSDRESFQTALEHYSDDELMIYVPDVYQEDIYRIDYARLKENGIKLISFDIDDTIDDSFINKLQANAPGLTVTMPGKARELVQGLKAMGFTVVLLTNAQQELAEGACKDLGADYCIARAKKPETSGFEMIASRYGVDKSQMAHVGNSMRADIAGGNKYGVTTCLVRRAGTSMKLVKFVSNMLGVPTKGHLIREKLLERNMWRKHHVYHPGDQYYQLGEEPEYRRQTPPADKPVVTIFYDGKAPYAAAFNLCRHIQSMGIEAKLKDAGDYDEGYPGKVIIIGHHDLTKKQLAEVGVLYNSYGLMLGYTQDKCVLRVSRSSLGKGRKGRKKFEEYYNTRILSYKELAASYNVPMQFGSRDETRKSQYDLIWLIFATHWLYGFLGKTSELGQGAGIDIAQQAANDLIQKVTADKDKVYTLEELLRNTYKANESDGMKTLRKHLGDNIAFTCVWADARDERELEESKLLDGELSGYVFTVGGYTIRSTVCLYQDDDEADYTQQVPARRDMIAQYQQENWRMLGHESGVREVQVVSARYNGSGSEGWQHICIAATSIRWDESINFIGTLKPSALAPDEQEVLFILKQYTGDSFGVAHWYKLAPDGNVTEYEEHPYSPESFEASWKD